MLIPKIGCVPAHPANVHRLLYDERQLVLVFPEGRKGTEKTLQPALPAAPLRARRVRRGGDARRAKLVPVCVVGAEEAAPTFAQVELPQAAHRAALLPDHPDLPLAGPAGDARLPAGQVPAPLPRADRHRRARWSSSRRPTGRWCRPSPRRSGRGSRRTCTRCSPRASRCGSDERREIGRSGGRHRGAAPQAGPGHRPLDLLGRAARAGARGAPGDRGDHRGRLERADARARAHRVRQGRQPALADRADRQGGRDRHRDRHPPGRRLDRRPRRSWRTRTTSSAR